MGRGEPEVRDKYSYFSFVDDEAEVQESAFRLGQHKSPETEL